ncbi:class I adenylate-forming enzyme family protein [Haliea sp. E17]|uniref:class I adenylate-forming enzyme family protein n=1 Tax=Haliea sp. E17 TaxID=3401576 RepID=UPI003AAFF19D
MTAAEQLSIVHGIPLADEPGQGAHTIPGYLREVTARYADSEALVMHGPDGVLRWTYREFWEQSMAVAKALVAAGVGKDARVGILMTNRAEFLTGLFGTALAGGVAVALSTFSTPVELDHLLKASDVSVLLYEDRVLKKDFAAMLAELEPAVAASVPGTFSSVKFPFLQRLVQLPGVTSLNGPAPLAGACESYAEFIAAGVGIDDAVVEARATSVQPTDNGGLFFSSGSTSLPKGILHSQRAFTIQWWRWPRICLMKQPVRSWTSNGFFWSGNISIIVGTAFSTGGAIILQPLFDAEPAIELIQQEKATLVNGRPHQWARFQESPDWDGADFSSLKYIFNGDLMKQHPTVSCDWREPMSFGTTETMTILSTNPIDDDNFEQQPGSYGLALPGNILKIVDPHTRQVMPRGESGELCIKGPTLMSRYIGKSPEETFDDEGFFCTGDGAFLDERGVLFWQGRLNDIIKTGGANVSPQEVDKAISLYPGIRRTQTVGVPHDTLSEMVVSCVVPVDGATIKGAELIGYLKQQLASFKVPREVLVFSEEEFPMTGNEKVKATDVKALACARLGIS